MESAISKSSKLSCSKVSILLLLSLAMLCLACDHKDKIPDHLSREAVKQMKDWQQSVSELLKDSDIQAEVKKLRQKEYEVRSIPLNTKAEDIKDLLNSLGKENWDCLHMEKVLGSDLKTESDAKLLIFCSRKAETVLQYVPQNLLN